MGPEGHGQVTFDPSSRPQDVVPVVSVRGGVVPDHWKKKKWVWSS